MNAAQAAMLMVTPQVKLSLASTNAEHEAVSFFRPFCCDPTGIRTPPISLSGARSISLCHSPGFDKHVCVHAIRAVEPELKF